VGRHEDERASEHAMTWRRHGAERGFQSIEWFPRIRGVPSGSIE
jgi:hypothetical protein